jgi:hypothetical protein
MAGVKTCNKLQKYKQMFKKIKAIAKSLKRRKTAQDDEVTKQG